MSEITLEDILDNHGLSPHTKNSMRTLIEQLIATKVDDAKRELIGGWLNWVESGGGHIDKKRLHEELEELNQQGE